jgi:hypothetical protein
VRGTGDWGLDRIGQVSGQRRAALFKWAGPGQARRAEGVAHTRPGRRAGPGMVESGSGRVGLVSGQNRVGFRAKRAVRTV